MRTIISLSLFISVALFSCNTSSNESQSADQKSITIVFGSCAHEDEPQPMLDVATNLDPDVFIYLGDNIYGDSRDMDVLKAKYAKLSAKPEFQRLRQSSRIMAVWDDHDFGENDAGRHYPFKAESKDIFLDFWEVPDNSARRSHPGIYDSEYIEAHGLRVQFILLDTRTFRDDLRIRTEADTAFKNDYVPYETGDSTFLGETQWNWLESVLLEPADLRIVASSNQFAHTYNGWESWTNMPHERQRFVDLIKATAADRLMFISGDVHWGEISQMDVKGLYPLLDVTSSGITQSWPDTEPNLNRVGDIVRQNNIGMIKVSIQDRDTTITMGLIDSSATLVTQHTVHFNTLVASGN